MEENNKEEKKKLLLVTVSVGVFLVIVVAVAILIFRPGAGFLSAPVLSTGTTALQTPENNRPAGGDYSEMANDANKGIQNPGSPIQENTINIYGGDSSMTVDSAGGVSNTRTVIVPKPETPAVPSAPAPAKPAPAAKPAAQPAPAAAKPAVTAATPAAPKKTYRDYWVQAGSFSTKDRADGVKSTLGTKGISAVVTNQNINGSTYYRVRVGPYTSQNEADYWLAMIKSIDGFQDSQIWESQSYR